MARGTAIRPIGKRSSSFTGKSKVISTGKLTQSFKPTGHMFGRQSVKAAKAR
jgi:hypothetical protein